jgi:hypothetical protein
MYIGRLIILMHGRTSYAIVLSEQLRTTDRSEGGRALRYLTPCNLIDAHQRFGGTWRHHCPHFTSTLKMEAGCSIEGW